ncbi:ead/Ea22-like family protein [Escherichia coli]|uniref:ead/Ea22-like family protein n=1 Tax=Escherichia coli TaxID=562 RepID=UPI0021CA42E7|nr:ead/Ea22-like family protein [Escherichia coli]EHR8767430.1 ead/Ea22-like family protein [Escherichia coli]EJH3399338.1 ead/Ea22-like family protein [Escherichia coli]EMC8335841.1 ead/Ea22-like family protein [Escherichia coli]HEI2833748.1 ead/Ea22-like family protein [Escherichia coli]
MSEINYQALREIAKQATQGEWVAFISPGTGTYAVHTPGDKRCEDVIKWPGFDGQKKAAANARYIAAFNPEVVQALLDEREAQNKRIAELEVNLAALAAENAALKRFIKDSCYVFHGEQADISDEYSPADESPLIPDTPAIDAILEKSRAQGIQIAINELVALAPSLDKRTMDAFSVAVERLRKLLKKGASSEQN